MHHCPHRRWRYRALLRDRNRVIRIHRINEYISNKHCECNFLYRHSANASQYSYRYYNKQIWNIKWKQLPTSSFHFWEFKNYESCVISGVMRWLGLNLFQVTSASLCFESKKTTKTVIWDAMRGESAKRNEAYSKYGEWASQAFDKAVRSNYCFADISKVNALVMMGKISS